MILFSNFIHIDQFCSCTRYRWCNYPPTWTRPLRVFEVGYEKSKAPLGSTSMKPLLVACGIFNFNDIMHIPKAYTYKDCTRYSSAECLIVAVQEISVFQFPPPKREELLQSFVAHKSLLRSSCSASWMSISQGCIRSAIPLPDYYLSDTAKSCTLSYTTSITKTAIFSLPPRPVHGCN